jgi:hypothetical protein
MNELVEAQVIPLTLVIPTDDLVTTFNQMLFPHTVTNYDLREIMTQISEQIDSCDKKAAFESFRRLPKFDRIVCKQFIETIERQHLLKSAVFTLATGLYQRLEDFRVFDSYRFPNKFPYCFDTMMGNDAVYFHIPY